MESEPEQFDCDRCLFAAKCQTLDDANLDAWQTYHRCYTRFAMDWSLLPFRVQQETAGYEPDAVLDLLDRMALIYGVLQPPPPRDR